MALVLFEGTEVAGISRLAADPDNVKAEFAVLVRSDLKGRGLGHLLLQRLIQYARDRGLSELTGEVLEDNVKMLALCRALGFRLDAATPGGAIRASLSLRA
jgi:acetyltransferase